MVKRKAPELSGEQLAAQLAHQLARLEAMRRAAAELMARDQLGRDFFARGSVAYADLTPLLEAVVKLAKKNPKAWDFPEPPEEIAPLKQQQAEMVKSPPELPLFSYHGYET